MKISGSDKFVKKNLHFTGHIKKEQTNIQFQSQNDQVQSHPVQRKGVGRRLRNAKLHQRKIIKTTKFQSLHNQSQAIKKFNNRSEIVMKKDKKIGII